MNADDEEDESESDTSEEGSDEDDDNDDEHICIIQQLAKELPCSACRKLKKQGF